MEQKNKNNNDEIIIEHDTYVQKNKTYQVTITSNKISPEAIHNLAKIILEKC